MEEFILATECYSSAIEEYKEKMFLESGVWCSDSFLSLLYVILLMLGLSVWWINLKTFWSQIVYLKGLNLSHGQ